MSELVWCCQLSCIKKNSSLLQIQDADPDDEDNEDEWGPEHSLVEIFPEVLSHQAEGTEEGPAKSVKICVPVIWVLTEPLKEDKMKRFYISNWVGIQWSRSWIPRDRRNSPDRDQPHWSFHTAGSSSSPPSCTSSCGCCWTAPTPRDPPPKSRSRFPGWSS